MFVKSLSLRGFKSFAGKTRLDFDPGIICVVGPNGSGKSNIVDALAWVMGEQGAKNLRGGVMSDIIFAGAGAKAGLGRAEVSLTIDNSAGDLPIDYSEVTISRSLLRSGGSEYLINGTPCRLLDIQELLSDTGMGRNMHVIVGQGQLDQVLSVDPMQRRALVEEAAGVLKHQRRKDRALKKLASLEEKLLRLQDLTGEVHRQLGPLARQAKTAKKAAILQARQRDAQARLLADDICQLRQVLQGAADSEAKLATERRVLNQKVVELRQKIDQVQAELAGEGVAAGAVAHWQEATGIAERLRGLVLAAQERDRGYQQELPKPEGPDMASRQAQLAGWQEQISEAEIAAKSSRQEAEKVEEKLLQMAENVRNLNRGYQDLKQRLQAAHRREEKARRDYEQLQARLETLLAQQERYRQAQLQAGEKTAQLEAELSEFLQTRAGQEKNEQLSEIHLKILAEQKQQRAELDQNRTEVARLRAEASNWRGRENTLKEALEGKSNQAKTTVLAEGSAFGTVGQFCEIPEKWVNAIASYLGLYADAVLLKPDTIGRESALIKEQTGIVRYFATEAPCVEKVEWESAQAESYAEIENLGVGQLTPALAVLKAAPQILEKLAFILENCALVEDLEDLGDTSEIFGAKPDLVIIDSKGQLRGKDWGQLGKSGGDNTLALSTQLQKAQKAAETAEKKADNLQVAAVDLEASLQTLEMQAQEALAQIRQQDADLAEFARLKTAKEVALENARLQLERSENEVEKIGEQITVLSTESEAAKKHWESLEKDSQKEDDTNLEAALDAARAEEIALREKLTRSKLTAAAKAENLRQLQARHHGAKQSFERYQMAMSSWEQRRIRRSQQRKKVAEIVTVAEKAVGLADRVLEVALWRKEAAEIARIDASEQLRLRRQQLDQVQDQLAEVTNKSHHDQVAMAEYRVRLNQMVEEAKAKFSLSEEQLLAEYGPHLPVPKLLAEAENTQGEEEAERSCEYIPFIRSEQEEILAKTTSELNRIGKINPLALAEHEALEQRYQYLMGQLTDLQHSKADLHHLIKEVDDQVDNAFQSAYADISAAFTEVFADLFPGGQGRLTLTDENDMLHTGIEIEARPAGKKVKRLSLLSGGERSLAALAFLVAIFTARPSPFYILDEVEAALDDSNLARLLAVFKRLRQVSQLIIITHQKRTMEIADSLYGISMRDGISTVISQRLQ